MANSEFFRTDYPKVQAYRAALRNFLRQSQDNDQDMLIDTNDQVILFETKLIMRKFQWDEESQSFHKVPTGVRKSNKKDDHTEDDSTGSDDEGYESEINNKARVVHTEEVVS